MFSAKCFGLRFFSQKLKFGFGVGSGVQPSGGPCPAFQACVVLPRGGRKVGGVGAGALLLSVPNHAVMLAASTHEKATMIKRKINSVKAQSASLHNCLCC